MFVGVVLHPIRIIMCFSESKMNDVDTELVSDAFEKIGYNIIVNNRKKLSNHRSGGILIAYKKYL